MLIQFSVENYKSIRDELIINFCSEKKKENNKWVVSDVNMTESIYKCIGLIGPNASGKSNIINAIYFALKFIDKTISRKDSASISVEGFGFSEENKDKPTSFEFIFMYKGIKYIYGFSINSKEVIEEYLMGYFTAKAKTIFDRSEGQKYNFKGNDVKLQKEIAQKTNDNRLYMPVAAEWGYEPAKVVMEWFDLMSRQYVKFNVATMIKSIISDEIQKAFLIKELQKADFNIVDIYVERETVETEVVNWVSRFLEEVIKKDDKELTDNIKYRNKVMIVHKNSKNELFEIDMDEDSDGTKEIIKNMAEIMYIGKEGGLMLEDELGGNYHTKLTQYFLNVIKSKEINEGNAQLLFSSHDTKILNILNTDQIYLVDKDDDGATYVKLLSDYQIRPEMNVELGYLKGKFGGIPYMRG